MTKLILVWILILWEYSKTQIVIKKKSICYKTQELKLWQKSKPQSEIKLNSELLQLPKKTRNPNCDKGQQLKVRLHSKTQIFTNSNSDKTQEINFSELNFWHNLKSLFVRATQHIKYRFYLEDIPK